jgi:hypothetical protein
MEGRGKGVDTRLVEPLGLVLPIVAHFGFRLLDHKNSLRSHGCQFEFYLIFKPGEVLFLGL